MTEDTTAGIHPDRAAQASDGAQAQIDRLHSQMALYARDLKRMVDAERQNASPGESKCTACDLGPSKSEFLANMSHELRTPLSNMIVLDLLDPNDEPQALAEMIDLLRRGYERLEKFVEKGLEYFQWLVADEHKERTTVTDLTSVARNILTQHAVLQKGVQPLVCDVPATPYLVRGAAEHLARVLRILLDNAQKFSGEDSSIVMQFGRVNGNVTLSVTDRGCGFAPRNGSRAAPSVHCCQCDESFA
jgi:signal transduction histidine kinase